MSANSVVSTPSAAGKGRSFSLSWTSARTTRNRCPVARSISSPLSASIRLTEAPTVPYPRSATPTSTADMRLRAEQPFDAGERAQLLPDPLDLLRLRVATLAQLGELGTARFVVAEELLRECAAADLLEDPAHPFAHAVV